MVRIWDDLPIARIFWRIGGGGKKIEMAILDKLSLNIKYIFEIQISRFSNHL